MYAQKLKEVFDVYYVAPIHAGEEFSNHCKKVFYKKEEVIKRVNQKEKHLFFLLNGSAGIFLWKKNNLYALAFLLKILFSVIIFPCLPRGYTFGNYSNGRRRNVTIGRRDFLEFGKCPTSI